MTDDELRTVLGERLAEVRGRVADACAKTGRDATEVTVVAVTKTVSARVAALIPFYPWLLPGLHVAPALAPSMGGM